MFGALDCVRDFRRSHLWRLLRNWQNFFPAIVTGSVITTIGLTLIPVAIGNMGGNVPDPTAGSLTLSLVTVAIILLINIFTKGS